MDSSHLEELERARLRSLVDGDFPTAERLHADDYQLITPGGGSLSRREYLELVASDDFTYETFEPAFAVAVRVFEDVAIARYQARINVRFDDGRDEGLFWHTDIWERRDGRWQAVWSQATRIRIDDAATPASTEEQLIES